MTLHFIFPIPFNLLLLPTPGQLCPESPDGRVGGTQGHCPETPVIVSQFSHLASVPGVNPTQFPAQQIKGNSDLLLACEASGTGYFSEIPVLLLSQGLFHPSHFQQQSEVCLLLPQKQKLLLIFVKASAQGRLGSRRRKGCLGVLLRAMGWEGRDLAPRT